MKSTQLHRRTLARLRNELHRHAIKQVDVARAAGVSKHMVCHVLAGRAVSANVVGTARRLIEDAKHGENAALGTPRSLLTTAR